MTKMKRSEFKSLVKECVRECLREIMQEQINPVGIHEMLQPQQALLPAQAGMINPMDDHQMRMRQEIIAQRGMMQGQLQRQATHNPLNPMQSQMVGLTELAGLGSGESMQARRYDTVGGGYTNPSDRLRFADQSYSRHPRFDPHLDAPPAGSMPQQARPMQRMHERLSVGFDPDLDRPIGGGDLRPPDPNLLRSIYDDTMRTTYVQQQHAETAGPMASREAAIVANHAPEDLFGASSQNWAMLAFK